MKKGSQSLSLYISFVLFFSPFFYLSLSAHSRFRELTLKTRALIKGWVYKGWVQEDHFFEVEPGKLYRCSQLPPSRLEQYIKQYGIKTIINLSGDEPFYWVSNYEKELAQKYNIVLFNYKTNALIVTPVDRVRTQLAMLLSAPQPILVHCFAGSDRTGEACALYLLAMGEEPLKAVDQLSPTFKHKKWLFPYKSFLIMNMEKIYPGLLESMQQVCTKRLTYEELKDVTPENLMEKIREAQNKT